MAFSAQNDAEPPGRGLVGWSLRPTLRSFLEPRSSSVARLTPFCVFPTGRSPTHMPSCEVCRDAK
eukprot:7133086-Alexandrium_andersonii.AAC.1